MQKKKKNLSHHENKEIKICIRFVSWTYTHLCSLSTWGEDPDSKNRLWGVLFRGEKPESGGPEDEEWG